MMFTTKCLETREERSHNFTLKINIVLNLPLINQYVRPQEAATEELVTQKTRTKHNTFLQRAQGTYEY